MLQPRMGTLIYTCWHATLYHYFYYYYPTHSQTAFQAARGGCSSCLCCHRRPGFTHIWQSESEVYERMSSSHGSRIVLLLRAKFLRNPSWIRTSGAQGRQNLNFEVVVDFLQTNSFSRVVGIYLILNLSNHVKTLRAF